MKNSRKLILIVLLALLLIAAIIVAVVMFTRGNTPNNPQGGDNQTHQHEFSTQWSSNEVEHWHEAICGHNVTSDRAAHNFGTDNVCDTCGYTKAQGGSDNPDGGQGGNQGGNQGSDTPGGGGQGDDPAPNNVTVTFAINYSGGTNPPAQTVTQGNSVTLPTVSRTGYTLDGWYDSIGGGTLVGKAGASYVANASVTLYAHWTANQQGGGQGDDPTHQHEFSAQWSISDAEHWHAATCNHNVTADNAAHTLVNNVCSVCGYKNNIKWNNFIFRPYDDGYVLTKYNGTAAHVNIPDTYNDLPVVGIGDEAFSGCESLVSVTIPNCVTSIGNDAFSHCYNLATVNFGVNSKLESIEDWAFAWCDSLTSIFIHEGVANISYAPFWGCYSLIIYCETSEQPSGWDSHWNWEDYVFQCSVVWNCNQNGIADNGYVYDNVDGIRYGFKDSQATVHGNSYSGDVTIPSNVQYKGKDYIVTSIDDNAFHMLYSNLTSITILDSITSIGDCAFNGCDNLATVNFGANSKLQSIGDHAFYSCNSLKSITIPDSTTSIGESAFANCNLATFNFGTNSELESIGESAFNNCGNLTSITIPKSVTSIGDYAFFSCNNLTTVNFVANSELESIGARAFEDCGNLTSITIPDSVTSIGGLAFRYCYGLTSIFIPKSVINMGGSVFYDCYDITIYCETTSKPYGWESDWNCFRYSYSWDSEYLFCPVVWGATRQDAEQH